MRLHHVNVVVGPGRTDSVVPFYELLGLIRVSKPALGVAPEGAWFDISGGTQLHVSERSGQRHPDQHFALVAEDYDALVARLVAAGHTWRDGAVLLGARRGMTSDPAGNAVEVLEQTGPFT